MDRVSLTPKLLFGLPSAKLLNPLLRFRFLSYKMIAGEKERVFVNSRLDTSQLESARPPSHLSSWEDQKFKTSLH